MTPGGATDAELAAIVARAFHMMGPRAEASLSMLEATAWEGLVETSRRLRRDAEAALEADGLGISMLGILGRLSRAEGRTLRQTSLAQAMGLSLSRISRIVDLLEERGLVGRSTCPADARAVNVTLTETGAARAASAQERLFTFVRRSFLDLVEPDELEVLATVFTRVLRAGGSVGGCACDEGR